MAVIVLAARVLGVQRPGGPRPGGPRPGGPRPAARVLVARVLVARVLAARVLLRRPPGRPPRRSRPPSSRRHGRARRPLRRTSSIRRLNVTLLSLAFAISLVLGRLMQLQGVDASRYRYLSHKERVAAQTTPAVRGEIVSSDGTVLAMTMRTDTVYADPPLIKKSTTFGAVAARLAGLLHMSPARIVRLLQHPSSPDYVKLKDSVIASTADAISKLVLPGIAMTPTYQRAYPGGSLAAPLLGFVHTQPELRCDDRRRRPRAGL